MSEVMQHVASPVAVDFASFEDDVAMLFPDPAMPIKAVATTVSMATDEDAWLFGSDKLGVAVRDIHVTSAEPLTIDLPHHNDDDLTSILMSPILGSPVDELDAMTSFLDEHVDPFQQVPVSSDDEPMSPASSPINTRRSSAASAAPFDAKKLDKLKATVANLEKIYYARSHGSKQLDLVRALERAQRITCNVARENFAFRASAMPRKAREELLLQEMSTVLKGAMMNTQIEQSVTDTVCSTLIENTASRAADAAKGLVTGTGESFMGWHSVKYVDATTGLMMFNAMKDFSIDNTSKFDAINSQSWDLMVSSDNFVSFMNSASSGKTVRSHLIKKLSDDAMLIAFDYVVSDNLSARVEREVCVAFRACTSTGTLIGVSSLSPTLFESTLHSVDGVKFIEAGMRWVQFSASKAKADGTNDATVDRFRVVGGGRAHCPSKEAADTAHMESLALLLQWERHMIAPLFSL